MPEMSSNPEHAQANGDANANGGEPRGNTVRGREDTVYRLRALVWLSAVRAHKKAPWETAAMDRYFLGDSGRAFWRVMRYGRDPGLPREEWANRSLVDRVADTPGFQHTKEIYSNALWEQVLGPTMLSPSEREILIQAVLQRLGLFEPSEEDQRAEAYLGLDIEALRPLNLRLLRQRVTKLTRNRSIDAILLMCLYYRRAVEETRLDEARMFAQAIFAAIHRFCSRPGVVDGVEAMWTFITRRRVIAGQRSLSHCPRIQSRAEAMLAPRLARAAADRQLSAAEVELHTWKMGCVLDNQPESATLTSFHPRSPELNRYLVHRPFLIAKANECAEHDAATHLNAAQAPVTRSQRIFADQQGSTSFTPPEWE